MKKTISLFSVNMLFLGTMLLVLTLGSVMQLGNLSLGLIGTEFLLILLPAVLFLRANQIPLREGLRLRPVGLKLALVSVALGVSTFLFTIYIEGLMIQVTGMLPVSVPESMLPKGVLDSILYFVALAVAAPICEEALFRGVIQQTYENQRKPVFAIVMVGLMFAFYHFRLSGLPALLPVAFLLGYAAWRTQSLIPSILIHFGMNASSATNTLVALNLNQDGISMTSPWLLAAGIGLSIGLLWLFIRLQPVQSGPVDLPAADQKPASRFRTYWPLGVAMVLYLLVSGLTLAVSLFPEFTAVEGVQFNASDRKEALESHYQISDRSGDVVGNAVCRTEPGSGQVSLRCTREIQSYEAQTPHGFFSDAAHTSELLAVWDAETMELRAYSYQNKPQDYPEYSVVMQDGNLIYTHSENSESVPLPDDALLEMEWAWRSGNLSTQASLSYKVPFGYQNLWNEDQGKSMPQAKTEILQIIPLERLTVPAGTFDTWKATVGGEAAWYASDEPSRPVQFDDGMVIYALVK